MRRGFPPHLRNPEGAAIASIQIGSGSTGALLLHGYLATPEEMRGLAEHLAQRGLMVYVPLVAGHGTTLREFAQTTWRDWYASVESALVELQRECSPVFVVGMSLGGLQALHLAAHHPELAGVVALAPVLSRWRGARGDTGQSVQPAETGGTTSEVSLADVLPGTGPHSP